MRLEQSRRAKADLDDIRNYSVVQFGSDRAIAYPDAIETVFKLIVDHPMAGRRPNSLDRPFGALPVNHIAYSTK